MQDDSTQIEVIDAEASRWLATIENADRALAEAVERSDLPRIVAIRDQAAALAHLADQQRYAEQWQRQAVGIKLRSERAAGEILAALEREAGKRRDVMEPRTSVVRGSDEFGGSDEGDWEPEAQIAPDGPPPSPYQQALEDNGIATSTAKRWQIEAALSQPAFERFMAETDEPTQAGLLKAAKALTSPPKVPKRAAQSAVPTVNRRDVAQAMALLDDVLKHWPEGVEEVAEVKRILRLVAKAAGLG